METVRVLLISTYDLGRQPFGLASPAAWLRREGIDVDCVDTSRDAPLMRASRGRPRRVLSSMHTPTRLAAPVIARIRQVNPSARLAAWLIRTAERELATGAGCREGHRAGSGGRPGESSQLPALTPNAQLPTRDSQNSISKLQPRLRFVQPDRSALPPLTRASLHMPDGSRRVVGSTDATRGCKHLCRHCPIVPVYRGTFRVIPLDVVLDDVHAQAAAGAHISFGDPDFLNGRSRAPTGRSSRDPIPRPHLRRHDQDRAHPAPCRHARPPARHGMPDDHERRGIGRR